MVNHFDYKHRCLVDKIVPIALILPSRWQDGAESLGIELTTAVYGVGVIDLSTYKTSIY